MALVNSADVNLLDDKIQINIEGGNEYLQKHGKRLKRQSCSLQNVFKRFFVIHN